MDASCALEFLGTLVNEQFEPVVGSVRFQRVNLSCDLVAGFEVLDRINGVAERIQFDFTTDVLPDTLRLDGLTFLDGWQGCEQKTASLLVSEETVLRSRLNVTYCKQDMGSPEWLLDPCCNHELSLEMCCSPRAIDIPLRLFSEAKSEMIAQQCSESECTETYVEEYGFEMNRQQQRLCDSPAVITVEELSIFYRECKRRFQGEGAYLNGPPCRSDSECEGTRLCDVSLQVRLAVFLLVEVRGRVMCAGLGVSLCVCLFLFFCNCLCFL
jgi:hypothetical protein